MEGIYRRGEKNQTALADRVGQRRKAPCALKLKKALQLSIKSVIISKLPKSIRAEKGLLAGKFAKNA